MAVISSALYALVMAAREMFRGRITCRPILSFTVLVCVFAVSLEEEVGWEGLIPPHPAMTQANEMYKAIPEIRRNRFTLYRLSV